jgi:hypothetical protein
MGLPALMLFGLTLRPQVSYWAPITFFPNSFSIPLIGRPANPSPKIYDPAFPRVDPEDPGGL